MNPFAKWLGPVYDCLTLGDTRPRERSYTCAALVAVFPQPIIDSYDFATHTPIKPDLAKIKWPEPFLIDHQLLQVTVDGPKGHNQMFSGGFADPYLELLETVAVGDNIVCWMFDNLDDYARVRQNLLDGKPCNAPSDGLKFWGKAWTVRENTTVDARGFELKRVSITAKSFDEFDSHFYYDPALHVTDGKGISIRAAVKIGGLDSAVDKLHPDQIIAYTVAGFMGTGVNRQREKRKRSPNEPILAHPGLLKVFGLPPKKEPISSSMVRFYDLLTAYVGVQRYRNTGDFLRDYVPTGGSVYPTTERIFRLEHGLNNIAIGQTLPTYSPFWSIMELYLNPVMNEMYTGLRLDNVNGTPCITPQLIARQLPFTPNDVITDAARTPTTPYFSLPRWKIDDLVFNTDLGTSNSQRFNMFQWVPSYRIAGAKALDSYINALGFRTDLTSDIVLHGVKTSIQSSNAAKDPKTMEPGDNIVFPWYKALTEMRYNDHLKLSGSMACPLIQAPIVAGDNVEYGGTIYHIESVRHVINSIEGNISGSTVITATRGINMDPKTPWRVKRG